MTRSSNTNNKGAVTSSAGRSGNSGSSNGIQNGSSNTGSGDPFERALHSAIERGSSYLVQVYQTEEATPSQPASAPASAPASEEPVGVTPGNAGLVTSVSAPPVGPVVEPTPAPAAESLPAVAPQQRPRDVPQMIVPVLFLVCCRGCRPKLPERVRARPFALLPHAANMG